MGGGCLGGGGGCWLCGVCLCGGGSKGIRQHFLGGKRSFREKSKNQIGKKVGSPKGKAF